VNHWIERVSQFDGWHPRGSWEALALLQESIVNGQSGDLYYYSIKGAPKGEGILSKLEKELYAFRLHYTDLSQHGNDVIHVWIGENFVVNISIGKAWSLTVASTNQSLVDHIKTIVEIIPEEKPKVGRIFVTTQSKYGGGLTLEILGAGGVPLQPENYSSSVHGLYQHVIEDLKKKDPCGRVIIINGAPGTGKCLGKGVPVLLANGTVIPVEKIKTGDQLIGPNGEIRNVLSTNKGYGPLYKINPVKGEPWVCNNIHMMTLVKTGTNEVIDIPLNEWLSLTINQRTRYKLFSRSVDKFKRDYKKLEIDPYFLGVWFGDGTKTLRSPSKRTGEIKLLKVGITTKDRKIRDLCEKTSKDWALHVTVNQSRDKCPTYILATKRGGKNNLLDALSNLVGPKVDIPEGYLYGDYDTRLKFLAGYLDADGEMTDNCFSITQKREDWARAIWWIARSLGLCSVINTTEKYNQYGVGGIYYRVSISGEIKKIPVRLSRRKPHSRRQKKIATRTGFSAEYIGDGDYYGFSLDGDGRFLLGDFTVTHNTFLVRGLIQECYTHANFVIIPSHMIPHLSDPQMISMLVDQSTENDDFVKGPIVLVVEDADSIITTRMSDNMEAVSSLLNFGSGILGSLLDVRILATTNAMKPEIDPAIMRPGRLCRQISVPKLSEDHVNSLLAKAGLAATVKSSVTLAEYYQIIGGNSVEDNDWNPCDVDSNLGFSR